ncbi:MAG: hypothetical protein ACRDJ5_06330, partial [Actinomycetota bacterium]
AQVPALRSALAAGLAPRVAAVALVGVVFVGACGGGEGASSSGRSVCVPPSPMARDPKLPAELPLTEGLDFTSARVDTRSVIVEAVQRTSVSRLYDRLRTSVTAHGYDIVAFDFEGFEAEIFFSHRSVSAGALRLREGPCKGQVTVTMLFDPIDTAVGKRILDRARARLGVEGGSNT